MDVETTKGSAVKASVRRWKPEMCRATTPSARTDLSSQHRKTPARLVLALHKLIRKGAVAKPGAVVATIWISTPTKTRVTATLRIPILLSLHSSDWASTSTGYRFYTLPFF